MPIFACYATTSSCLDKSSPTITTTIEMEIRANSANHVMNKIRQCLEEHFPGIDWPVRGCGAADDRYADGELEPLVNGYGRYRVLLDNKFDRYIDIQREQ